MPDLDTYFSLYGYASYYSYSIQASLCLFIAKYPFDYMDIYLDQLEPSVMPDLARCSVMPVPYSSCTIFFFYE